MDHSSWKINFASVIVFTGLAVLNAFFIPDANWFNYALAALACLVALLNLRLTINKRAAKR